MCTLGENTSLFRAHFEAKQCRNSFQRSYFCDLRLVLRSVALLFSLIRNMLLDLDSYSGNGSDGMFPPFTSRWLRSWHLSWV